jgi:hypothetical protein
MLTNIIQRATEFGTIRAQDKFLSFILKIFLYIVPAAILGHYTDVIVKKLQKDKVLGEPVLYYIILQTFIIVSTIYLFTVHMSDYAREFQLTLAGMYFVVLYFNIQTNYIVMIQEYMHQIYR